MAVCGYCGKKSSLIAKYPGYCKDCIVHHFNDIKECIENVHRITRKDFNLPVVRPQKGEICGQCVNDCRIRDVGYCGLIRIEDNRLKRFENETFLEFYHDALPTNCVASWVCAAEGKGYPEYSYTPGPEYGYKNLAVFFRNCTFNCLYCQNWHFKEPYARLYTIEDVISKIDEDTACICFFGGDPTPSINFALNLSEAILKKVKRIFRICWETNGSANKFYIKRMLELSLESGGILKIDFKAITPSLHYALCGADNRNTLENIEYCALFLEKRRKIPVLVVSTLLVPGYIDEKEIREMAKFLSKIDKKIPWSFLAFYPTFYMKDLPTTSRRHAQRAVEIAREYGMENVKVGNLHLLSHLY